MDAELKREFGRIRFRLDYQSTLLEYLIGMEVVEMAFSEDLLAEVRAGNTAVDSLIALVKGLQAAGTITPEQGATILSELKAERAKVEAALVANVV